jgi:hypothetical protein
VWLASAVTIAVSALLGYALAREPAGRPAPLEASI